MTNAWSWTVLRAGAFRLDGGSMFGVVPKAIWAKLAPPDEANRIPLQTNCLLVRSPGTTVLIETGYGGKWDEKERKIFGLESRTIVDALREQSIEPDAIDHVIVSHLHFDHAGGLTRHDASGDAVATFPNATVHVQQREWEDALANRSTMTKTYLRSHLDPVADRIALHDGEEAIMLDEAAEPITVWPMPGHTWGQQAIRFHDAEGTVCFAGDVLPTVNHVGLAFSMGYDMEPYTNMHSKRALLERAAQEHWRLALDHEPDEPVVRVQADPDRAGRFHLTPSTA